VPGSRRRANNQRLEFTTLSEGEGDR
jgi:hypothetical protein